MSKTQHLCLLVLKIQWQETRKRAIMAQGDRLRWQSRGLMRAYRDVIYPDLEAREGLLNKIRSPMEPERETRVQTLKNWRKMVSGRGDRLRLRVKKRQGIFGKLQETPCS